MQRAIDQTDAITLKAYLISTSVPFLIADYKHQSYHPIHGLVQLVVYTYTYAMDMLQSNTKDINVTK